MEIQQVLECLRKSIVTIQVYNNNSNLMLRFLKAETLVNRGIQKVGISLSEAHER
jgi:hypothetical protein